MYRETLQAIYHASKNAGTDVTRTHLSCVRLLPAPDESVRITSTNGHVMTDATVKDELMHKLLGDKAAYVMDETFPVLKVILSNWPKRTKFGAWPIENVDPNDADAPCIKVGEMGVSITLYRRPNGGGEYPNVEEAIPKNREKPTRIAFDAAYLLRVAKVGAENQKHPRIILEFEGTSSPITVKDLRGKQIGVLMPVRADL